MKRERTHTGRRLLTAMMFALMWSMCFTSYVSAAAKLNKKTALLYPGKSLKLKVTGYSGKISWKSGKKSVATVSQKGLVKAKKQAKLSSRPNAEARH